VKEPFYERERKINHTGRRRRGADTEKRLKSRTGRSYLARFPARLPPSPLPSFSILSFFPAVTSR